MGGDENKRVFIIDSQDQHMKRALLKLGWLENKNYKSQFFDLKWKCSDIDSDYNQLHKGQNFNHFLNNRSMTTKSGLIETLYWESRQKVDEYFFISYDIGKQNEQQEFRLKYFQISIFNSIQ